MRLERHFKKTGIPSIFHLYSRVLMFFHVFLNHAKWINSSHILSKEYKRKILSKSDKIRFDPIPMDQFHKYSILEIEIFALGEIVYLLQFYHLLNRNKYV